MMNLLVLVLFDLNQVHLVGRGIVILMKSLIHLELAEKIGKHMSLISHLGEMKIVAFVKL